MRAFASLDLRGLFIVDEEVDTEAAGVDAAAREVSGQDRVARLKVKLGRQDVEEQDVEGLLRKRAEDANREGGLLALGPECAHSTVELHSNCWSHVCGGGSMGVSPWTVRRSSGSAHEEEGQASLAHWREQHM